MKGLGAIQEVLHMEGWNEIEKQTKNVMDAAMIQLANIKRPAEPSDDALRGYISGLKWVLDFKVRVTRALAEEEADRNEQAAEASGVGSPMEPEATPTE